MTPVHSIGISEIPTLESPSSAIERTNGSPGGPSFADALGQAVGEVEKAQVAADSEAEKAALGGGNLHEAALALEKADISMRLAVKIRNKAVDAYQEVMRMSI